MHLRRTFWKGALAVSWLALAVVASAKDGRDFNGQYQLTGELTTLGQVRVDIVLRIFNRSGEDLGQAVVAVRPTLPALEALSTLAAPPNWRNGRDITIGRQFTVPEEEFARWKAGQQPGVFVIYTDSNGRQWQRWAQLNRVPMIGRSSLRGE